MPKDEGSSQQTGCRPCVCIQNDIGNKHAPTVIIAAMTSKQKKKNLPTHFNVEADMINGLYLDSIVLCEQILTVSKHRLIRKVGSISDNATLIEKLDHCLMVSQGIIPTKYNQPAYA